ncbi:isopeptide-forming domain-containing fimbrial protein [Lysinibacillus sp. CTST325]
MKKIAVVMMVILLVFSELNVYVADTFVGYENPTTECEEQAESVGEEESAIACEEQPESESLENLTTEDEEQPESGNEENSTTEGEEHLESGNEENPATEGEEQPESEKEENPTTEGEERPESGNEENPTTEGEEQPESEKDENLTLACEEQLESGSEENMEIECEEAEDTEKDENLKIKCEEGEYLGNEEELGTEGEEQLESNVEEELAAKDEGQLESNIEEELAAKDEGQLESNIEEKLAAEDEGQLESNIEEELVTESEEKPGSNSKEKSAPKCIAPRAALGNLISSVGRIGNIDFSMLDDSPNELAGFTQMTRNEGLEFPTRENNSRTHYMYFGDIFNSRPVNSLEDMNLYNKYHDDWGRPLPNMDTTLKSLVDGDTYIEAQNFSLATVLAQDPSVPNTGIITYYFNSGRPAYQARLNPVNADGNGLVIAQGGEDGRVMFQSTRLPLLKLYKNENTHQLIAYAAVINGRYVDGYVKIKMSLVDESAGRINVSMKYLKLSSVNSYTNLGYSVHKDILNTPHTNRDDNLFSLGNNEGLYFHEKNMGDGQDYFLYFLREGYANNPVALQTTDFPTSKPFNTYHYFNLMNSPGADDPDKGDMYPNVEHPGFALRWQMKLQMPNEIREENLEIAITNKPNVPPEIWLDNNGEYTDNGYHIEGKWKDKDSEYISLYYTVDGGEPKKIGDYENPNFDTDVSWEYTILSDEMQKGFDHDITVYAIDSEGSQSNIESIKIRPKLNIKNLVLDKDGNALTEIAPGETLYYKTIVDSGYKDTVTYGQGIIMQKYDNKHLKPPTDLKVINENGDEIGKATYNASSNRIDAILNPAPPLPRSTKIYLTFNAEVKEDAAEKEYVVSQVTAIGSYSTGDTFNKTIDEVKIIITGVLKFVSVPQEIDFGEKLSISPKNKTYYPIKLDTPLAVKDNRSLSKKPSWAMTAKLDKQLTGKKTGSRLLDSLHYNYDGNVSILTEDASAQIYIKETTNSEVVNISDTWNPDGDGLYLDVRAGTAKADAYEGTIRWVLQDVPPNQ